MANYQNLKAAISAAIRTNGNQEITGQVLQNVLNSIVSVIGANYTFAGVATPATNPGTPDQNVMYLAMEGGTYTNFNGTVLPAGISLLMWNGTWTSETVMYGDGGVFDISVYKSSGGTLATFADLTAALGTNGANIPEPMRKGGMTVKFVQSSDNKYVQFRLKSQTFSTDINDWQDENNVPVSKNDSSADLDVTDEDNNVLVRFKNGHIKTEKFDSTDITAQHIDDNTVSNNKIQNNTIEDEKLAKVHPVSEENLSNSDLDITDNIGNIVMQLKGGHIQTKNFNSRDIRQNVVIVDVNGNGKYSSITEASASEPANTVFLIMPGVYDDENVQGCNTKKQHFIGLDRDSTIVKNHQNGRNNCVFTIGAGSLENLTIIKEWNDSAVVETNSYAVHADSVLMSNETLFINNCFIKSDNWACAVGMGMKGGCHVTFKDSYFIATRNTSPAAYAHDNYREEAVYDGIQTWTMIDCVFYSTNCQEAIGFQSMCHANSIYNIEMIRTRLKSLNTQKPYWIRNIGETEPTTQDFLGLVNGRLIETSWGNSCSDFNNN